MSGKVSDLPIRSKRALFRQKKLDRINFKSGKRGRVLRNPPGVTTGQWVTRVVRTVHGHMILCHMVLTRYPLSLASPGVPGNCRKQCSVPGRSPWEHHGRTRGTDGNIERACVVLYFRQKYDGRNE